MIINQLQFDIYISKINRTQSVKADSFNLEDVWAADLTKQNMALKWERHIDSFTDIYKRVSVSLCTCFYKEVQLLKFQAELASNIFFLKNRLPVVSFSSLVNRDLFFSARQEWQSIGTLSASSTCESWQTGVS